MIDYGAPSVLLRLLALLPSSYVYIVTSYRASSVQTISCMLPSSYVLFLVLH